jgi:hypothetical protein
MTIRDHIRSAIANKLLELLVHLLPATSYGHEIDLIKAIKDYCECDSALALASVRSDRLWRVIEKHLARRVDLARPRGTPRTPEDGPEEAP